MNAKVLCSFCVLFTISSNITISAQTSDSFLKSFIEAYNTKKELYCDTNLVYIPTVENLFELYSDWIQLSPSQRKDSLFVFLKSPILANDIAIDTKKKCYYRFSLGRLYYNGEDKGNTMAGPIYIDDSWYNRTFIAPLIDYIVKVKPQYIFSVENFFLDGQQSGWFWTIENDGLYVLLYNKELNIFYRVDVNQYINNVENDVLFSNRIQF